MSEYLKASVKISEKHNHKLFLLGDFFNRQRDGEEMGKFLLEFRFNLGLWYNTGNGVKMKCNWVY